MLSALVATGVLVSVALVTGHPLLTPAGVCLWVAVLVAHDVLVCEQRDRIARAKAKAQRAKARPDTRGLPRHTARPPV